MKNEKIKPPDMGQPTTLLRNEGCILRHARIIKEIRPNMGVCLDYGSGNSEQTNIISKKIISLDLDTNGYDGKTIPYNDNYFDTVLSFNVLEHTWSDTEAIREIYRVLRVGGVAMIFVPNKWWIFETHGARLPILRWERVPMFSWLPKPIHSRLARARIYTRHDLLTLLNKFDNVVVSYMVAPMDNAPLWCRSFLRRTLFSKDITTNPFISTEVFAVCTKKG